MSTPHGRPPAPPAPPARLTLLHTAAAHQPGFAALARTIAPDVRLRQLVRADWLERAQTGTDTRLAGEIAATVRACRDAGEAVLCTCTTIGPDAEAAGALRIDAPMMHRAAEYDGTILLVYCLESTRAPSAQLLADALGGSARRIAFCDLTGVWPLFAAGDLPGFHAAIADRLPDTPDIGAAVLAQASMAGAAPLARRCYPVLASPELALRTAMGLDPQAA
ncbi:MAG: hypothetical protein NXH82_09735 [Rhodobacteraceae bacterium]|nr:hypothetical protein [Paracoccaceae bacterium]